MRRMAKPSSGLSPGQESRPFETQTATHENSNWQRSPAQTRCCLVADARTLARLALGRFTARAWSSRSGAVGSLSRCANGLDWREGAKLCRQISGEGRSRYMDVLLLRAHESLSRNDRDVAQLCPRPAPPGPCYRELKLRRSGEGMRTQDASRIPEGPRASALSCNNRAHRDQVPMCHSRVFRMVMSHLRKHAARACPKI